VPKNLAPGSTATPGAITVDHAQAGRDIKIQYILQQAARYAVSRLHQLRAVPQDFVGREAELAAVVQQVLAQPTLGHASISAICSVNGLAGIGKTELANLAAHALAPQFPDAQLFVPLAAHSSAPRSARQAMEFCLTSFDPEVKTPDEEALLRAAYVSAFQGKRCLLLLDDARNDDHIAPLLPPPGCAVIVTSRARLACSRLDPLDTLPLTQAADLLRRLCSRLSPAQAAELARLCGCLPIALSVAGGHLNKNRTEPAEEFMRRLSGPERLKNLKLGQLDVQAVFEASYAALEAEQKAGFRALAVMPAGFDRAAALAVVGGPAETAASILDELAGLNLLRYDDKTQRFRWHDLLREFARNHAKPEELDAAKQRHTEHFISVANEASGLYHSGGGDIARGLVLFDLERGHMEAAFDWLASRADKETAGLLVSLVNAVGPPSSVRFDPRQRIQWLEAQVKAARLTGDREGEDMAICNLAGAYGDLGDQSKATSLQEKALLLARERGDRRGEGVCIGNLGHSYLLAGDPLKAIELLEQSLIIARECRDQHGEAVVLGNLGIAHENQGNIRKAIPLFEQQLAIAKVLGDRRCESSALCNLGAAFAHLEEMPKAMEACEQALRVAREMGDRIVEGGILGSLGAFYGQTHDTRRAIACFQQQREIFRQIGNGRAECEAVGNLGHSYTVLGDLRMATELLEEALLIARETGNRRTEGHVLGNLGHVHMALAEFPQAIEFFSQAAAIASEVKDQREEAMLLYNCALAMGSVGNRTQAIACTESALQIFRAIAVPPPTMLSAMLAEWREEEDVP
jgi:tetratricopeptide (TPR) repeat protein